MQVARVLTTLAAAWWALVCLVRLATVTGTFLHPGVRRRAAVRRDRPPLSLVIPVAQVEPDAEAAFASAFSQDYPDFEVLITSADQDSPTLTVARAVAARYPGVPTRFLLGNERRTLNPKVSNLAPALTAAENDLILVKDSNVWLPPDHLTELVSSLTPGTGMACSITVNVQPVGFPSEVECAMTNAHAAPWLMGGSLIRLDIGFGKVMLFHRRDLERAGGLDVMASTFGDDHALAKALARVGLRTVFSPGVVRRVMARRTLGEVWDRQLRWMMIRRAESFPAFLAEPFFSAAAATLAAGLAAPVVGLPWWGAATGTFAAWVASDWLVVAGHGWGWSWRLPFAALARETLLLGLWLRTWTSRHVPWAGSRFAWNARPPGAA